MLPRTPRAIMRGIGIALVAIRLGTRMIVVSLTLFNAVAVKIGTVKNAQN